MHCRVLTTERKPIDCFTPDSSSPEGDNTQRGLSPSTRQLSSWIAFRAATLTTSKRTSGPNSYA
eukprot:3014281-Rhodomonas_salina.1